MKRSTKDQSHDRREVEARVRRPRDTTPPTRRPVTPPPTTRPLPQPRPGTVRTCTERVDVTGPEHPDRGDSRASGPPAIGQDGQVDLRGIASHEAALASETAKLWDVGQTLRVKFVGNGGSASVRSKVRAYAEQWTQHANVKLQFVDPSSSAEIKIAFDPTGSWSTVGRDALWVPFDYATMNYGWLDDASSEEYSRVVLHEFGHALGFIHEHQSPAAGIPWNAADRDRHAADRGRL